MAVSVTRGKYPENVNIFFFSIYKNNLNFSSTSYKSLETNTSTGYCPPSIAQTPVRQAQMIAPQPQPFVGPKKRGRPKKIVGVRDAMAKSGPKKLEFE
jgi:hypothetical protein